MCFPSSARFVASVSTSSSSSSSSPSKSSSSKPTNVDQVDFIEKNGEKKKTKKKGEGKD
jgi:hypothetical protein